MEQLRENKIQQRNQTAKEKIKCHKNIEKKKSDVDKEIDKKLRRPRSDKHMDLLSKIDYPSMIDKEIIDRMKEDINHNLSNSLFEKQDIESYLQTIKSEFEEMIKKEIKDEMENCRLQLIMGQCLIPGCEVHTFEAGKGWESVIHYSLKNLPKSLETAYHLYNSTPKCESVEIYTNRIVAIASGGEVLRIIRSKYEG